MRGRHVLIVGGGASGALAAAHLLRDRDAGFRVTVIDPGLRLGRGLAYGTPSPSHLLNARVRSMSAFDDLPGDLAGWLEEKLGGGGWEDRYIERRLYGGYLEDILRPWTATCGDGRLVHLRDTAVDVSEHTEGVRIDLASGASAVGHASILAMGHGLFSEEAPSGIPARSGDVLILGTGLGMVDEVLSLLDAGHTGRITALSRRGQLPRPHGLRGRMQIDAADVPLGTHLSYLMRWMRHEVRAAPSWNDFVDALRPHVPAIWENLPDDARRRFLRHARPWWDTHRHRMAPPVADRIAAARATGRLEVVAGRIRDVQQDTQGVKVTWQKRGTSGLSERCFAKLLDRTGPRKSSVAADMLLGTLERAGTVQFDSLGIGIRVSSTLAVASVRCCPRQPRLFAIGPMTCPKYWETYAIPEIRQQCAVVSRALRNVDEQALRFEASGSRFR